MLASLAFASRTEIVAWSYLYGSIDRGEGGKLDQKCPPNRPKKIEAQKTLVYPIWDVSESYSKPCRLACSSAVSSFSTTGEKTDVFLSLLSHQDALKMHLWFGLTYAIGHVHDVDEKTLILNEHSPDSHLMTSSGCLEDQGTRQVAPRCVTQGRTPRALASDLPLAHASSRSFDGTLHHPCIVMR